MTPGLPWRRILAEGAVIVVSILFAFAIDRLWETHQASIEQQALVETLLVETQEADRQLDAAIAIHTGTMCNARGWLSVTRSTPLDSVAGIVGGMTMYRTPNLSLSVVEGVLSAGQLASIQDEPLRAWISEWPGVKEDFDEEMRGIIQFVRFVVPEYFVSRGIPRDPIPSDPPLYPFEAVRPLVGDGGFGSLMRQAFMLNEVFVREGGEVRRTLQRGAALARAALGSPSQEGSVPNRADLFAGYAGAYEPTPETVAEAGMTNTITVSARDGRLLAQGGDGLEFRLDDQGNHTFLSPDVGRFRFVFSVEGDTAHSLHIHVLDPCAPDGVSQLMVLTRVR